MDRRRFLGGTVAASALLLAACTNGGGGAAPSSSTGSAAGSGASSGAPASGSPGELGLPAGNPGAIPGVPTNSEYVARAIDQADAIAQDAFDRSGVPGMAVAVVHGGKTVFAKGYGVREVGRADPVDADTVFQLASVSKPIGATVVAEEVGKGTVD